MRLPNGEKAIVDIRKVRDYCLNPEHPRGQHKARVFKRALGWTSADAEQVHRKLLEVARTENAIFLGADDYGQRYAVDFVVQGAIEGTTIRSLWVVRHGENFPRFASCYVI